MKITGFLLSALLTLTLLSSTAMAGKKDGKMMKNPCDMKGSMMSEGHQMNQEMMDMLRETMSILKGLNHKPTAAEQQKLGEMMGRIDQMKKQHKEMMEKKMEWKEKKMNKMNKMNGTMDDSKDDYK